MNTRTIIAAASIALFAGAAAASEAGTRIDFTDMQSSMTRADVMAQTRAFNAMHDGTLSRSNELYGRVDPLAASSDTTRAEVMAETSQLRQDNVTTTEAYNGFGKGE